MNKEIFLKKNTVVLFTLNIIYLISILITKNVFNLLSYDNKVSTIILIISIIGLLVGVVFNILLLIDKAKYNEKRFLPILVGIYLLAIVLGIVLTIILNKPIQNKYNNITNDLNRYCEEYGCETFEVKKTSLYYEYILSASYITENNYINKIKIHNKYNRYGVYEIEAYVYSDKNSFTPDIIKEHLDLWFKKYNCEILSMNIINAFEKRFENQVADGNITYKVTEIYEKKALVGLETKILVKIKQD